MEVRKTKLDGVLHITPPTIFEDMRGWYIETYNKVLYSEAGIDMEFIQDDISVSTKDVLRGIHGDPHTWKLISCLYGRLYFVIVNNDETSPQYRQWESFLLSDTNREQVLVPPKFGNGHLILSDLAIFHYKQTSHYDRASQFTIPWNDPSVNIWWPVKSPIVSQRDEGV
ncbi:dTDP-4-dehydrorhamnose 3,5-epimerase family protein [Candidatus Latescibacterota bacterium]